MTEKKPSVFAGIKLTDQTSMARPGLDQRLFSSRPATESPAVAKPRSQAARHRATPDAGMTNELSSNQATTVDTTVASNRDTTEARNPDAAVARFARAIRRPGKESATLRLTAEEKTQLADLVYTYRRRGRRTSETELIRIAIHSALADYQENGENSVLGRVLTELEP